MLRLITVGLILILIAGFVGHAGGGTIHLLLVLAAVALLIEIFSVRRMTT